MPKFAPWDDETVEDLNRFQHDPSFHGYTCGNEHKYHIYLVATRDGWICPKDGCDYTQNWAH